MKKLMKPVVLVLVLITMVFALAACAKPAENPDDAVKALKESNYLVERWDDEFAATVIVSMGIPAEATKGLKSFVLGVPAEEDAVDGICICYYENANAADNAYESIDAYVSRSNENAGEDAEKTYIKSSGNMIWFGTSDAIKAAR